MKNDRNFRKKMLDQDIKHLQAELEAFRRDAKQESASSYRNACDLYVYKIVNYSDIVDGKKPESLQGN